SPEADSPRQFLPSSGATAGQNAAVLGPPSRERDALPRRATHPRHRSSPDPLIGRANIYHPNPVPTPHAPSRTPATATPLPPGRALRSARPPRFAADAVCALSHPGVYLFEQVNVVRVPAAAMWRQWHRPDPRSTQMSTKAFEPYELAGTTLSNRIVMAPMT